MDAPFVGQVALVDVLWETAPLEALLALHPLLLHHLLLQAGWGGHTHSHRDTGQSGPTLGLA